VRWGATNVKKGGRKILPHIVKVLGLKYKYGWIIHGE
jgi:hypothetical protein